MFQDLWQHKLFDLGEGQSVQVNQIVLAVVVLLLGFILSKMVARIAARRLHSRNVRESVVDVVHKAIFYVLLVAVFFTSLHLLHIPMTIFAFLGGAIAIGFGFGAQNIINNLISGWILIAERPVRVGDLVEVQGHLGHVSTVGARCTRIRRSDGIDLLVPNSALLEQPVVNWTLTDRQIRTVVRVGVMYGSPTERVAQILQELASEHEDILKSPAPIVIFDSFGDSALEFDVYFWASVRSMMDLRVIESDVRFQIDARFRQEDIVIAFPQRDVHVDTTRPLEVRVVAPPKEEA